MSIFGIFGKSGKDNAKEWHKKGQELYKLGKYQDAITYYDKATETDPEYYVICLMSKGLALKKLGRYKEAIACCDKLLNVSQNNAPAWFCKGTALFDMGRADEALLCYDKVISLEAKTPMIWYSKAYALYSLGRFDEALQCVEEEIKLKPDSSYAQELKQKILKRETGKETVFSEVTKSDAEEWYKKGYALYKQGKHQKAISCYDKALEINPSDAEFWLQRGIALDFLGKDEEALISFDKALGIDSKYAPAWFCKGATLSKSIEGCNEALKCVDEAIKIDPELKGVHELKQLVQLLIETLKIQRK